MTDWPVMLKVRGRRCLIVGGGTVALRRAKSLAEAGGRITVVAPIIHDEFRRLPAEIFPRPYTPQDMIGAWLVVIATDDPQVNQRVQEDARSHQVLVNRTDESDQGDLQFLAHHRAGPVTIAVHTDGISAQAAATIRDQLASALDPAWPLLLEVVRPYRQSIQSRFSDPAERADRLRRLTDAQAMNLLRTQGIAALQAFCDRLLLRPDDTAMH